MNGKLIPLRRVQGVPEEMSDAALLAGCASGDIAALGAIYDRFHMDVWRFCSRLLSPSSPELDDLVQSTFLEVWRSASNFKGRSSVKSWVFGIANNLARHHIRKESRRRSAMALLAEAPKPTGDTGKVAEDRLMLDRLNVALRKLPHDQRVAFVMCELEELKGVEAAKALGVRPGTLWRRLHEARKALKKALEEEA